MQPQESTIDGFKEYWLVLKRRWKPALAVFLSATTLGIAFTELRKPIYVAEAKLRFKKTTPTSNLKDLGIDLGNLSPLVEKSNPLKTEAEVVLSGPVIEETLSRLNWTKDDGDPLEEKDFKEKLSVTEIKGSDILEISFKDKDANKAAEAVNTLVEVYLANDLKANRSEIALARQFLEKQMPKADLAVRQVEEAMRRFKEDNKVVSVEEEAKAAVEVLMELEKQIATAQGQLANAENQSQELKKKLGLSPEQALTLTAMSQSEGVQQVLKELQEAEAELKVEKARFTEDNPKVIELTGKVDALKTLAQKRIGEVYSVNSKSVNGDIQLGKLQQELTANLIALEGSRIGLLREINQLATNQTNYRERAKILPKLEQQFRQIQRKLEASQTTYLLLLKNVQELSVLENQNIGNVRIIEPAVVPKEPDMSRPVAYLASGLLGLLAAAGATYLLESSDKFLRTVEQTRKFFEYTWLGVIPNWNQNKKGTLLYEDIDDSIPPLIVKNVPESPLSESYRMLLSNLKFLSSDTRVKVILVTSSIGQEGKSTVAANLATAMAQVGHRTLLIDADLHHPVQHRVWDIVDHNKGLSNLIAEQIEPERLIRKIFDRLDVLPSGVIPPSPATLLDSQRMASLMQQFATKYDYVILDTPALNLAADASILSRMVDGVLLVVKPGSVDTGSAQFAKEILQQTGKRILGMVINGVLSENEPYSYYYHGLENKQELSESAKNMLTPLQPLPVQEDLWDSISRLARESKEAEEVKLEQKLVDIEQLNNTPLDNLQEMVGHLQQDLNDLISFVNEQEEELALQRQTVELLERKMNASNTSDRLTIEEELAQELEKKKMLTQTIVGQRRNLQKRQEILGRYQWVLQRRKEKTLEV